MFKFDPAPSKNTVVKMVHDSDIEKFGDVEGRYLYTPRDYAFYNKNNIYVVDKRVTKANDQYIVIKPGEELTKDDEAKVEKIKLEGISDNPMNNIQVKSKHRILIYENANKVREEWFYKVIFTYNGEQYLTFTNPKEDDNVNFNFFTKGYGQFRDY